VSYPTVPPDNRQLGDTGHLADHSNIADAIAALEANVPEPPGGTADFLRADSSWAVPPGVGGATIDTTTGDIAASPGTAAAGSVGEAADAGHVHPQPTNFAPTGVTGATATSKYVGATSSGHPTSGTHAVGDYTVDQTGSFWICTGAGTPGTWIQVVAGSVVGGVPTLDSTAADIQPDGVQTAGAVGKAADAGHIHPEHAWQSLLIAPSGALAETYPRRLINASTSISSGLAIFTAIPLPAGLTVTNISFWVASTAQASGTHGWYAITDSTFKVLAVSADQTSPFLTPANTIIPLAMGTPYIIPAAGVYYLVASQVSGSPTVYNMSSPSTATINTAGPQLSGSITGQAGPPSVGATLTTPTAGTGAYYAYVS
jgi:hypothetical protein